MFHLPSKVMICQRCEEPLLKHSVVAFPNKPITFTTIACSSCNSCVGIKLNGKLESIDEVLGSGGERNGWMKVTSDEDNVVYYVLNKVLYEQYEAPDVEKFESTYDLPDSNDVLKILWYQGVAIGFYTLKLKGTYNEKTRCKYEMTTLDTAYIRCSCRRKGFGTSILKDLITDHPDQDIGLSKPISTAMWNVLHKFLMQNSQYRLRFWEIEGTGREGERTLVWYSLNSKSKKKISKEGRELSNK
ncbi:hypothetical protein J437_LFUL000732 [Ladona fulva]|uniref:N-acetyltransferase domain-containing protein n=1 Tax=Ladona fulva TaxID=123851 RepID=A0A8K0JUI6_LADFU|nr:hypothetical protein J437_LFUL000732 [Ladona fulva]